jgi:hypothetical protein
MDVYRFDALTRALSDVHSRRSLGRFLSSIALGGPLALLGVAEVNAGKHKHKKRRKKCPPCTKRKQGKCKGKKSDGTACPGGTCQGGRCCVPHDSALVCAAGCGTRSDTCGGAVDCPCPAGQDCLGNGSCARTCNPVAQNCPTDCRCSGARSTEGAVICTPKTVVTCDQVPQPCTTSAECPQGTVCQVTGCGAGGTETTRCVPVCNG